MVNTKSIKSLKSLSPMKNSSPVSSVLFFIVQVIALTINVLINWAMISWIQKLDKTQCECSKDWKKSGLEHWAYFALFMGVLTFILNIFFFFAYGESFKYNRYFTGLLSILSFMNTIATLLYIYNLKSIDCKCSEDMKREILYIYNWLRVILMIIVFIIIIAFIASLKKV
jgi:hypothetical protein